MILLLLCIIFLCFPIIIWGYIFSYVDQDYIDRKRFFWGIVLWAWSLVPIVFLEEITSYISFLDVLSMFSASQSGGDFAISFLVFLCLLFCLFVYATFFSFPQILQQFKKYAYSFYSLVILIWSISIFLYWLFLFSQTSFFPALWLVETPSFQGILFHTPFLIILYYMIVATLEEVSKYFLSLQNQDTQRIRSRAYILLWAIFVALGFAFVENIFYAYTFLASGTSGVVWLMVFRSIFSTLLHVICTVIFFFGSIYMFSWKTRDTKKLIFSTSIFWMISVVFHTLYNLSLVYGYLSFVILAIIFWYFYISYILTRE